MSSEAADRPAGLTPFEQLCCAREILPGRARHSVSELPVADGQGRSVGLIDMVDVAGLREALAEAARSRPQSRRREPQRQKSRFLRTPTAEASVVL